ncbi:hypothetical protein GCM10007913_12040 [Devosia yakushimensis]|uniref:Uncharacterized protein n=1 Tax=Devosia yakushimensis TaxID=470028 RepID=A0ABQ5UAX4_9HYPH|nr:hypothetical protein [Devosia yakushimensis]GLQ09272.1 hypothetical protein GCM10007913_12040 [Devosia yakushimensis]
MTKTPPCPHMNFEASVTVARLEDSGRFMAEVKIKCAECGEPFQFLGLDMGLNLRGATVSADGLEANLAISPNSQTLSPFARAMVRAKSSH